MLKRTLIAVVIGEYQFAESFSFGDVDHSSGRAIIEAKEIENLLHHVNKMMVSVK